jgi:lipopolysaccharide biosynthesis regulator YciM
MEAGDKKFIFIYVRPITEDREPVEFSTFAEALQASREAWAFVKMDFDRENPYQKSWGLKGAPACIGADLHGNDFVKLGAASTDSIRGILRNTPGEITRYETRIKSDYGKAMELLKSDEERGAKALVDLVAIGKKGYKEIADAQSRLGELSESALRKGELASAVSLDAALDYYEELVKAYKASAPGVRAEIAAAVVEHARGNAAAAIARLHKIMKYDPRLLKAEVGQAGQALEEIGKSCEQKIDAALLLPDKGQVKEALRKLAKDYAGTEAGRHAAELAAK